MNVTNPQWERFTTAALRLLDNAGRDAALDEFSEQLTRWLRAGARGPSWRHDVSELYSAMRHRGYEIEPRYAEGEVACLWTIRDADPLTGGFVEYMVDSSLEVVAGWRYLGDVLVASLKNRRTVADLLDFGASPDAVAADGNSAILRCFVEEPSWAEPVALPALVEAGARLDVQYRGRVFPKGCTPLHCAAHRGNIASVRLLLRHGADPSARTPQGLTPLHAWAMQGGRANAEANCMFPHLRCVCQVLDSLLSAGADINATEATGRTPLDVLRENQSPADRPGDRIQDAREVPATAVERALRGSGAIGRGERPETAGRIRSETEELIATHLHRAQAALDEGQPADALQHTWAALRLRPVQTDALILMARIEAQSGHLDDAETWLLQALEVSPESTEASQLLQAIHKPLIDTNRLRPQQQEAHVAKQRVDGEGQRVLFADYRPPQGSSKLRLRKRDDRERA